MQTFVTNSHTLHKLMLTLGIVFKVEEEKPYRLINEEHNIAFLPAYEYIPDDVVTAVPEFATELQPVYSQECEDDNFIQIQLPRIYPISGIITSYG